MAYAAASPVAPAYAAAVCCIKSNQANCFKVMCYDVASDVGVNFKNVGVLSFESSLFHLFHYTFLQTKHQRKGY